MKDPRGDPSKGENKNRSAIETISPHELLNPQQKLRAKPIFAIQHLSRTKQTNFDRHTHKLIEVSKIDLQPLPNLLFGIR